MEAFSLLKYWRGGGGGGAGSSVFTTDTATTTTTTTTTTTSGTTTIITAVSPRTSETESDNDDDGPFFDLEFTLQDEHEEEDDKKVKNEDNDGINISDHENQDEEDDTDSDASDVENDEEFNLTLSSGDGTDPNSSLSPVDDLFFKGNGHLVPVEPLNSSEPNTKSQFPVSLLRSATKLRVSMLMLKLKKSKSNFPEKTDGNGSSSGTTKTTQTQKSDNQNQTQSKSFTVKFKIEEVPIMSLFTRDNSSKSACNKVNKQNLEENASEEKRFSKDVMQKYLKLVKPLYIRVSKRYGEKLRFSEQQSSSEVITGIEPEKLAPAEKVEGEVADVAVHTSNVKSMIQGTLPAVVRKHLGKSRSASSSVAAATSKRRDDSLLQQQDGIQGAILHCKRSFHASRDSKSSILSRSVSDPLHHEKSVKNSSANEGKETTSVPFESLT